MKFPRTLLDRQFRADVIEVERHWKTAFGLRIFMIVLCVVDAIVVALLPLANAFLWFVNISIGMSGVWTLVVVIFRLFMIKPIHPGVLVAFELVSWTGLVAVQSVAFIYLTMYEPGSFRLFYVNVSDTVWAVNMFASVVLSVLTLAHFYLFVRACIDESRRRSHEIATRAATIAAQIVKNMESRGTFYRRDSDVSYGFADNASGHIIGLENLNFRHGYQADVNGSRTLNDTGFAPLQSSRLSQISRARSGRTQFSHTRTQYSHTRSLSVPVPTSPRSLRTALTDEPSLFGLDNS